MARNNVDSDGVNSNDERRLCLAALNGDWKSVKNMRNIQRKITIREETTLHVAAAANQEEFVMSLLTTMMEDNLTAENTAGNTALAYAAAAGNVNIAKAMLKKNTDLPNLGRNVKPLYMAASLGHSEMVQFLYDWTKEKVCEWEENEQTKLFNTCIEGDLFGVALEMLKANPNLVTARNEIGETTLHVLARKPSAFVSETRSWLKLKQENSKQSQVSELIENCLQAYRGHAENVIPHAFFDAAEVGNIEFLVKLIRFDFDLLWCTREDKTIFHISVEKRHENIFNLLNEIGSIGDLIINTTESDGSNILHLAARLAPQEKLNAISGAALQMQQEILWFKEVEKVVPAAFKEMKKKMKNKNKGAVTPYVLFAKNHEKLRKEGEKWMINTANYSMLVATVISSIMFSGQIADGLNQYPKLYKVFSVSSAIALCSSSTSLVVFLSILTSRYSYEDFLVSLPARLMIGVSLLCISIATMMVAFFVSFWVKNHNQTEMPQIIVFIGLFACVPILYVLLKCHQFLDIFRSTFVRRKTRQRLLVDTELSEPANPANRASQELVNLPTV